MPRRGYSYFDPRQFVAEQMERNPFYNPLSPSPDILGGIRGTLNMMWGLKEAQREREEEEKQLTWEKAQKEWEKGIRERETAAEEARTYGALIPKPEKVSEWEAKWGIIDKLPISEDQKIALRLEEINLSDITAVPFEGAKKLMMKQGVDPATATPQQISAFNKASLQFMDDEARKLDKIAADARDVKTQTMARHVTMLNGMMRELDEDYSRIGNQIQDALKSGGFSDQPTIQIKKGQRHLLLGGEKAKEDMLVPNPKYKPYEKAIADHQKLKDAKDQLFDYLGFVEMGGQIQPEDMHKITALVKQGPRYKKYEGLPPEIIYLAEINKWTPAQARALYEQYLAEQGRR